jgi:LytS/YehU family sensor histidine kinase
MELKALRHQVDPHFLFNSLNSISALTQLDPAAARAMTIDLADYFRQTLSLGGRERIPLAQELELVQRYLAIEQRRMGDRLRLSLDIDAACQAAWLPPLLLQPLVEHAVKHGIRHLDEGGTIELRARHVGDRLVLRVANPVDADALRDTSGLGQGLRHLKTWLQTLYAEPTFVDVERAADHYTVQISLPWQP